MINYEVALGQFELFVLILIRLASFVYAAPFFNTANVPRKFKVGFAIALSVIVYAIHPDMSVEYDNMIDYCIIALQEVIVGVILGAASFFCVQIIQFSGKIIDMVCIAMLFAVRSVSKVEIVEELKLSNM